MLIYKILYAIIGTAVRLLYRVRILGRENIPPGAAVVCGNHTSNLDAVLICIAFGAGKPMRFMTKQELFKVPLLGAFLRGIGAISVNRGATDISTLRDTINILKSGEKVMIFPEGTRVRGGGGAEGAKTGAAMLACRARAPMLPVYISVNKRLFRRTNVVIGRCIDTKEFTGDSATRYKTVVDAVFGEILRLGNGGEL